MNNPVYDKTYLEYKEVLDVLNTAFGGYPYHCYCETYSSRSYERVYFVEIKRFLVAHIQSDTAIVWNEETYFKLVGRFPKVIINPEFFWSTSLVEVDEYGTTYSFRTLMSFIIASELLSLLLLMILSVVWSESEVAKYAGTVWLVAPIIGGIFGLMYLSFKK